MEVRLLIVMMMLLRRVNLHPSDPSGQDMDDDYQTTEIENHHRETLRKLSTRMNSRIRPNIGKDAVHVGLGMLITSLGSISERSMDFKLTFHLEQAWNDPRMRYNGSHFQTLNIPTELVRRAWRPDLYFVNDVKTETYAVPSPNVIFKLKPDGSIRYITRMTSRLSCPMELQRYPLDIQICPLIIESYSYDISEMTFEVLPRGIQMDDGIRLPRYHMIGITTENCTREYETGLFPCLMIRIKLQRQIGFYLLQLYLPSALMVALSWLSFWINASASVERMALGVTLLLTLTTMFYGARSALPEVSYLTALDLWMTACLVFVVAATLEFAVVHVRCRHRTICMSKQQDEQDQESEESPITNDSQMAYGSQPSKTLRKKETSPTGDVICCSCQDNDWVDYFSRVVFPMSFCVFNAIYWPRFISGYRHL